MSRDRASSWCLSIALGAVFAYANAVGVQLTAGEGVTDVPGTLLRLVAYFALFMGLSVVFCKAAAWARLRLGGKAAPALLPALEFSPASVVRFGAVMLVAWLPVCVAMYPGVSGYDTFYQVYQCYPHAEGILLNPWGPTQSYVHHAFVDHHPLFDTLLYGLFARASDALTGSWNTGFFALSLLHAAASALSLSASIAWTERLGSPSPVRLLAWLTCVLLPFFAFYSTAILKDTTHVVAYLPYAICVAETVRTRGGFLSSRRNLAMMCVCAVFVALTKKTGLYLVALTTAITFVSVRRRALRVLAPGIATCAVMLLALPIVIFPLLDAVPGGVQEKYGLAFQQVARCVVMDTEHVSESDKATIDAVIPYDKIVEYYDPQTTDNIKNLYRWRTCTEDDLSRFLYLWLRWGAANPVTYLESVVSTSNHFFDMYGELTIYESVQDAAHVGEFSRLSVPGWSSGLHDLAVRAYRWLRTESPLPLCLLFRTGLYSFLVPALAACCLARRNPRALACMSPLWVSMLFLLISPTYLPRYALTIIFSCPMLLCMCVGDAKEPAPKNLNLITERHLGRSRNGCCVMTRFDGQA